MNRYQKDSIAFFNRMNRVSRRCMESVLGGMPKCHFGMLHRLAEAIATDGQDGGIYVSDLARCLGDSPQAVSRGLRILETDGLVERCTDAADRRKTMVRLTEKGQHDHDACAQAMLDYGAAVAVRLGEERFHRMHEDIEAMLAAMEAEAAKLDAIEPEFPE